MDRFVVRQKRPDSPQHASPEPSKKPKVAKNRYFQDTWESEYFMVSVDGKPFCLICKTPISENKNYNVQRHYDKSHKAVAETKWPKGSKARSSHLANLKESLGHQQANLKRAMTDSELITEASYRICWIIAHRKKEFTSGEMVKSCFLEASSCLFNELKNKDEIISAISALQLSHHTVARRIQDIGADLKQTTLARLRSSWAFSIALDTSNDIRDIEQLCVWSRVVDDNFAIHELLVDILPMKERTRGVDICEQIKAFLSQSDLSMENLISVTTDGAPSMTGKENGLAALLKKDKPSLLSLHCIIHQQCLAGSIKNGRLKAVMAKVVKFVNLIRAHPLHHRQFMGLVEELNLQYGDLLLHCDVRWLSKGAVLARFFALLPGVAAFLQNIGVACTELSDPAWIADVAFLTDITALLNKLNLSLQGKDQTIIEMVSCVRAFIAKLDLLETQLRNGDYAHFPTLDKHLKQIAHPEMEAEESDTDENADFIAEMKQNFSERFADFATLDIGLVFIANPGKFPIADTLKLLAVFSADRVSFEEELLSLQASPTLFDPRQLQRSWSEIPYDTLKSVAAKIFSIFASTYLCEQTFSTVNICKNKFRSRLNEESLIAQIRCAVSSYTPSFSDIVKQKSLVNVSH